MKIINFANSNHVGLENLKLSIYKFSDWEHIVIGQNTKWVGWMTRMSAYQKYCESVLDQNEIIVFTDAYDVLCLRSPDGFLELYKQCASNKIVVGAEIGCHPGNCIAPELYWAENNISDIFPHKKENGGVIAESPRFVNGGLLAGPAHLFVKLWKWSLENKFEDDQRAIGQYSNEFPQDIYLDINSQFFFNDFNGILKYKLNDDNSITNETTKYPFFIHFHGILMQHFIPSPMEKSLFQVGHNYKTVGSKINGSDQINGFPASPQSLEAVWIERSCFYILLFILFGMLISVIILKQK